MSECRGCGAEVRDGQYCTQCMTRFVNDVRSLRLGLPELRLIAARKASVVAREHRHGTISVAPIPLNMTAYQLQEDIVRFARTLASALTLRYGRRMPAEALLKAVEQRASTLLQRRDSPGIIHATRLLAHALHRQLNPPEDRRLVGSCPECGRQLWLTDEEINAQWAGCDCGATLRIRDVQERHLLRIALTDNPNARGTAAAISRLLHANGIDVKRKTINEWRRRHVITPIAYADGKPVYRVWDVWKALTR